MKVVVGMSGGVDSSVAAYLLKQQGYEVIGVTMQIWQKEDNQTVEENGGCCGLSAVEDARRVAQMLDIPYYVMNFREEFDQKVIRYFMREYLNGRTPNPCIACNRYVKWESLLQRSMQIGADYIATGHYARIEQLQNGRYAIRNSVTAAKDQTYALYNLTQEQLMRTKMPVGAYEKSQVRAIAEETGALCGTQAGQHGDLLCAGSGLCKVYRGEQRQKDSGGQFRDDRREDRRASSRDHPLYRRTAQGAESLDGEAGICAGDPAGDK